MPWHGQTTTRNYYPLLLTLLLGEYNVVVCRCLNDSFLTALQNLSFWTSFLNLSPLFIINRCWDTKRFSSNVIKVFPHPSYVYSCEYHPSQQDLVVTGSYDCVVRVWNKISDDLHAEVTFNFEETNSILLLILFFHFFQYLLGFLGKFNFRQIVRSSSMRF